MGCRDLRFVSGKLKAVKPICSQELSERYIIDNFFFFFFFFFLLLFCFVFYLWRGLLYIKLVKSIVTCTLHLKMRFAF